MLQSASVTAWASPPARFHPDRDHGGDCDHGDPGGPDRAARAGPPRPGPASRRAPGHRGHHAGVEAVPAGQRPLSHHGARPARAGRKARRRQQLARLSGQVAQ
ncbi:hypothetical protein G6F24_017824 [Rhizopus arrhizus]|nr:hypothetical protein G6F24_017824 [Rhizopus arrhizus]